MAALDNATKRKLEPIFGMSSGYVLDFSNARFADFVKTAIGIDSYEKYPPASRLVFKVRDQLATDRSPNLKDKLRPEDVSFVAEWSLMKIAKRFEAADKTIRTQLLGLG
ncbi:hypothetical protein [Actinomadura formosensis]|uniref:hypothetical protein n=1 Tax=Actinomadura formosensis TaxID=60706 RepID=UPI00082FE59A|nr:hypothetical protein [Actinomadura formosensis]